MVYLGFNEARIVGLFMIICSIKGGEDFHKNYSKIVSFYFAREAITGVSRKTLTIASLWSVEGAKINTRREKVKNLSNVKMSGID